MYQGADFLRISNRGSPLVVAFKALTFGLLEKKNLFLTEDHHWWWRSVFSGGSTGVFIFIYCIYYFKFKARMKGFMQTSFFFGYMSVACFGFWLMLGSS